MLLFQNERLRRKKCSFYVNRGNGFMGIIKQKRGMKALYLAVSTLLLASALSYNINSALSFSAPFSHFDYNG